MKKLLLALALCSIAIPSVGFAESARTGRHATWIIEGGKTLIQSFDNKNRTAYFVKYCNQKYTGNRCSTKDDGLWFCSVNDEGLSICRKTP